MTDSRDPRFVVVRRGQFATFELLARTFTDDDTVRLIWDRRAGDRRQARTDQSTDERRRYERRRLPPSDWHQLHYLLTPPDVHASALA